MRVINETKSIGTIEDESELMDLIFECAADLSRIGLMVDNDVKFELIDSTYTFGECCSPRTASGKWTIKINKRHINDSEESVKNTIYHEFAHYFVNKNLIKSGKLILNDGGLFVAPGYTYRSHGPEWKAMAEKITSGLHLSMPITRTNAIEAGSDMLKKYKYIITCSQCGWSTGYDRRCNIVDALESGKVYRYGCPKCKVFGTLELTYN